MQENDLNWPVGHLDFDAIIRGEELWQQFLSYNLEEHRKYVAGQEDRDLIRAIWEMECLVLKCMDGRNDLTRWTQLLYGLVQALRTTGGVFDPGHILLRNRIHGLMKYAQSKQRYLIVIIAYHYSKSGQHLSCRFENGDRLAARMFARGLTEAIAAIYGRSLAVYPICVGMETDEEAITFEGVEDGRSLPIATLDSETDVPACMSRLYKLYPGMAEKVLKNLAEMAAKNYRHVASIRQDPKPDEALDHNEYGSLLGDGADFHHKPNELIILWPGVYDLAGPVRTSMEINGGNLLRRYNRLGEERYRHRVNGILLIGSAYFRDSGADERSAQAEAKANLDYQYKVLQASYPQLLPYVSGISGAVDFRTRRFHLDHTR
jgi:hypothetical protein